MGTPSSNRELIRYRYNLKYTVLQTWLQERTTFHDQEEEGCLVWSQSRPRGTGSAVAITIADQDTVQCPWESLPATPLGHPMVGKHLLVPLYYSISFSFYSECTCTCTWIQSLHVVPYLIKPWEVYTLLLYGYRYVSIDYRQIRCYNISFIPSLSACPHSIYMYMNTEPTCRTVPHRVMRSLHTAIMDTTTYRQIIGAIRFTWHLTGRGRKHLEYLLPAHAQQAIKTTATLHGHVLSHLLQRTGSLCAWKVCTLFKLDCQYFTKPLSSVVSIQVPLWVQFMLRTAQSWPYRREEETGFHTDETIFNAVYSSW